MIKLNKKHLIIILLLFFIFSHKVSADVVINEVQISPTGNRFIELYNTGNTPVDLTDWYIQRKTANGSSFGSLISKTYFEGKIINGDNYFLISRGSINNSDIIYEGLTLTESNSIQLKNSKGDVVDKVGWGDSIDCDTNCVLNPAENKSIQRIGVGNFIISSPTPKLHNIENLNNNVDIYEEPTLPISNDTDSSSLKSENEIFNITTKILSPKIVTSGVPFEINHNTTGLKREKIILGKFVWNFGDGMKYVKNISDPFLYTYQYPGEYVLSLSYFDSNFDISPDTTDRIIVKVISSGISISSIGSNFDPYVEIENNSNYEISLKGFILKGDSHSFIIPEGMIILPNKKLKLSPKVTGFNFSDLGSLSVTDFNGQIFATYPKVSHLSSKNLTNNNFPENIIKSEIIKNNKVENVDEVINLNNLGASVAKGEILNDVDRSIYAWFGLIVVIVIGIISIILLKKRDEDYPDYLEKEIKASDMTIIE